MCNVLFVEITYKNFLKLVNNLGTALFDLGYKGKRIAIVGRNRFEWVLTHFANLLGGIVSVPIDKELQIDELEQCIARSKASAVVFDSKYLENIELLKTRESMNGKDFICMDKSEGYTDINSLTKKGEKLLKKGKKEYVDFEVDSDAMNILLFTSGTSAKSKAVMLSQRNICSDVEGIAKICLSKGRCGGVRGVEKDKTRRRILERRLRCVARRLGGA